jgi:hypothetical protein
LSDKQQNAVRDVLGITDSDAWDKAMPRRMEAMCGSTVLTFQIVLFEDLSEEQQKQAQSELQISRAFWNGLLSCFHDKLWFIDNVTLRPEEFSAVLRNLRRMLRTQQCTTKADLARFLLDLNRVLLPSQALLISRTVLGCAHMATMEPPDEISRGRFNVDAVVASFLTDPKRYIAIDNVQLQIYWDDRCAGCIWGNSEHNPGEGVPSYSGALQQRYARWLDLRRCAAPILTGTIGTGLPNLPQDVARYILDDLVGEEDPVDPLEIYWLSFYQGDSSIADLLVARASNNNNNNQA